MSPQPPAAGGSVWGTGGSWEHGWVCVGGHVYGCTSVCVTVLCGGRCACTCAHTCICMRACRPARTCVCAGRVVSLHVCTRVYVCAHVCVGSSCWGVSGRGGGTGVPDPPAPRRTSGWRRRSWRPLGTTTWSWCRRSCVTSGAWRGRTARPPSWHASCASRTSRWAREGRARGTQGAHRAGVTPTPPLQSLLETHDSVASKSYETPPPSPILDPTFSSQPVPPDAVRMVGIRKVAGENLVSVGGREGRGTSQGAGDITGCWGCWDIVRCWGVAGDIMGCCRCWGHCGVLGSY